MKVIGFSSGQYLNMLPAFSILIWRMANLLKNQSSDYYLERFISLNKILGKCKKYWFYFNVLYLGGIYGN